MAKMKHKVTEYKLLVWLVDHPESSSKQIAIALGVTPPTLWKVLVPSVTAGRISSYKLGKTPFYSITYSGIAAMDKLKSGGVIYVTTDKKKAKHIPLTRFALLNFIHEVKSDISVGFTATMIAEAFKITPPTVWKVLVPATNEGLLHKTQVGKYRYYALTVLGKDWLDAHAAQTQGEIAQNFIDEYHVDGNTITGKFKAGKLNILGATKSNPNDLTKFTTAFEKTVHTLLLKLDLFYGAANIQNELEKETGILPLKVDCENALELLVKKGFAKKVALKDYFIYKAIPTTGAVAEKHIKPHAPAAFLDDAFKAQAPHDVSNNCGGADDVVIGEPDYLKQKEYGYKVVVSVAVVKEEKHNDHYDGFHAEKKAAIDDWGLNAGLDLAKECADFYTLYDLSLDFADVKDAFNVKRDMLAGQFANYIDMAVGGEVRHAAGRVKNKDDIMIKAPILKLIMSGALPHNRSAAWRYWKIVRQEKGLEALRQVVIIYLQGHWSSGFGGLKWGKGAECLCMFLEGALTPTAFVDTVWSLHHNNGFILNKVWNCYGLEPILDAKFDGKIEDVVPYASIEIQKLWKDKRNVVKA